MDDFNAVEGFDWDNGNRDKNWLKHGVSTCESEEVFFNQPLILNPDPTHSNTEPRFYVLGQTNAGRLLFIAFTIRKKLIRFISARNMSQKERTIYEQADS